MIWRILLGKEKPDVFAKMHGSVLLVPPVVQLQILQKKMFDEAGVCSKIDIKFEKSNGCFLDVYLDFFFYVCS